MAGMSVVGRRAVWSAVVGAALVTVGLVVVLIVGDLDAGDKIASVVGVVLASAGLVVAVVSLARQHTQGAGVDVRAGQGGVAAGRSITGSALGANSRVGSPPPAVPAPQSGPGGTTVAGAGQVHAEPGGIAAGEDISGSALGDGSQVQ
ncbi:hypothetical protein ACWGK1_00390 [Streptomyces wedmorensis]